MTTPNKPVECIACARPWDRINDLGLCIPCFNRHIDTTSFPAKDPQ